MTDQLRFRCTALGGLAGALLMLAGDFLLYGHWSTMPKVNDTIQMLIPYRQTILLAEPLHLRLSAILGCLASIASLFGAYHIYLRLERGSNIWAAIAGFAFAFAVILGGTYHAFWSAYGFILQFANTQTEVPHELIGNLTSAMEGLNSILSPPLLLALGILLARILLGKSDYPKWAAALTPLPLILLGGVFLNDIASALASPYGSLAKGTYFNVVMTIFFLVSLLCPRKTREA